MEAKRPDLLPELRILVFPPPVARQEPAVCTESIYEGGEGFDPYSRQAMPETPFQSTAYNFMRSTAFRKFSRNDSPIGIARGPTMT
jgi:hypothetical protein